MFGNKNLAHWHLKNASRMAKSWQNLANEDILADCNQITTSM
jgi:hypothetical protein